MPAVLSTARLSAAVLAVVGAFLAWTCLPSVHWHDSGEFTAVTWWLSLSHPPSHPVHALLSRPVLLTPLGDLAFRGNLSSGLALAAALGLFLPTLRILAPRLPRFAVALFAAAPVLWPALWLQGARAEVYAVQLLLMAGVVLCLARAGQTRDPRFFLAAGLVMGIAGACHSLLALTLAPICVAVAVVARFELRAWLLASAAGVLGLGAYAYLPIRASAGLDVGWGNPTSLSRLLDTVLARDWHRNLISEGTTGLDLGQNAVQMIEYGMDQLGIISALVLGLGVCACLPRAARSGARPFLAGLCVLVPVVAARFFYPFDAENPDMGGYLAPALLSALAVAAWAVQSAPVWGVAILSVAVVGQLDFDPGHRMGSRAAERVVRATFAEVPIGGVLVLAEYPTWFQSFWFRACMGERPDVLAFFRGRIGQEWAVERATRANPFGAAGPGGERLRAFPQGFDGPEVRFELGVERQRLGTLEARLAPVGRLLAAGPGAPLATIEAAWRRGEEDASPDRDTAMTLAFRHAVAAQALLEPADPALDAVRYHIERAQALIPGGKDVLLDDLWSRWQAMTAKGQTVRQGL